MSDDNVRVQIVAQRLLIWVLPVTAYWVSAWILCGSFWYPVIWVYNMASMPRIWNAFFWFSLFVSLAISARAVTPWIPPGFRSGTIMLLWIWLAVLPAGAYAEFFRRSALEAFQADHKEDHSFWESLQHPPEDFRFFLHAAAMRDCVGYAWSYKLMDFYRLDPNVAANVLPSAWTKECWMYG